MDLLTVVIPVHGGWALTRRCLESLAAHTPGGFWRVVVADGASPDETADACAPLLAALVGERGEHRRAPRRLSFAEACNLGARGSASELLFFLNNDTLLRPGWLEPLLTTLRDESRVGVVAPRLLYPGPDEPGAVASPLPACLAGRVQHAGVALDPNKHPVHPYHAFPPEHPVVLRPLRLQAVSGAAMLLPRRFFEELGGFCEGFVNGSEDLDLCARLRARGLRCRYEPRSAFLHLGGGTPGRYEHMGANARLLNERCLGAFVPDLQRLAARDGFDVRLNAWLEPFLVEAEHPNVPMDAPNGDAAALTAHLEQRPLDPAGYAALARLLRRQGDAAGLARVQGLRAMFFPGPESCARAREACLAAGDAPGAGYWAERLESGRRLLADPRGLTARAREGAAFFRKAGEKKMEAVYLRWIASAEK